MARAWLMLVLLVACGDDELPTCASLGCKGPLLCSSTTTCTCNGQSCRVAPDAGAAASAEDPPGLR